MPFKYPAFISYSSKDKPWAERLRTDLDQQLPSPVFLDANRLQEGKEWNQQLTDSLRDSEHLVVFYSANAAASDWVKHEMSLFNAFARDEFGKTRKLLCIQTDENIAPVVYTQIQHVRHLVGRGVYGSANPAALTGQSLGVWTSLIGRVRTRLQSNAQLLPLALVVMKDSEAAALSWNGTDPGGLLATTLGAQATGMGIADLQTLQGRYGATRSAWKPFGGVTTIDMIMGTVLGRLNQNMAPTVFEWDPVDVVSAADWRADVTRLVEGSVILVDPLSLYHPLVNARFKLLSQCFDNDNVVFLMLAPFAVSPVYDALRTLVRTLGYPMLEPYFEPVPAKARTATCAVGISDDVDLGRAIRAALLRGATQPESSSNAFISTPKQLGT